MTVSFSRCGYAGGFSPKEVRLCYSLNVSFVYYIILLSNNYVRVAISLRRLQCSAVRGIFILTHYVYEEQFFFGFVYYTLL